MSWAPGRETAGPSPDAPLHLEPETPGRARLAFSWTPPPGGAGGASISPPVWIFLHGLGADRSGSKATRFREWVVSRGHGFLSFDFTGHGESGGDCRGLTLTRNLEDAGRAVEFVRAERPGAEVVLIGSSMGGIAALWYAALHPEAVAQVFAIAPAFGMSARFAASLSQAERTDWARRGFFPVPIGERVLEFGWGAVADERNYPDDRLAAALRTPALLLHGDADAVVPVGLSRDFAVSAPAAELIEIADGDHRLTDRRDELFEEMWGAFRRRADEREGAVR